MPASLEGARRRDPRHPAPVTSTAVVFARSAISALVASFLLQTACSPRGFNADHEDIVLIVVDTLRADHLGAYGYGRDTSPRIDRFARQGTLFENAWSAAPWTLPSVMSIMTSRYPSNHRVENDGLKLSARIVPVAEALQNEGFTTGAFVSHVYVAGPFGFARGFGTFEDFGVSRPGYRLEAGLEPTADRVTDAALSWIGRQGRAPVFLFVHYFDPHWPYAPPNEYRERFPSAYGGPLDAAYDSISKFQDQRVPIPEDYRRFLVDRYDGEIRFVDDQIGRLMDGILASGRGARAWILLTADHGEEFKDHGSMGHGRWLYEESIRVPLVIGRAAPAAAPTGPGAPASGTARRVTWPVSGIDLYPTILDLAGLRPQAGLQGVTLVDQLRPGRAARAAMGAGHTRPPSNDRPLVSETVRLNAYRKAVRIGALKMIQFMDENRSELYDLEVDPLERQDLSGGRPEDRRRLARVLFTQVDVLSGGWNMRWSSDGRKRRYQGRLRTSGIFRTVVPLSRDSPTYVITHGDTLTFDDAVQAEAGGLAFTTAPSEASVEFDLRIDGKPLPGSVSLGGNGDRPPTMPFTLAGLPPTEAAFVKPSFREGSDVGFYIWRLRPAEPDQEIILDDEIRERLRSLGYVD
jgi:arylsulfatase A-like enzyme